MAEYRGQTTFHFCCTLQGHSAGSFMCRAQRGCNFWLSPILAWCYMSPGVRWPPFAAAVVRWFYRDLKGRRSVVSLIPIVKSFTPKWHSAKSPTIHQSSAQMKQWFLVLNHVLMDDHDIKRRWSSRLIISLVTQMKMIVGQLSGSVRKLRLLVLHCSVDVLQGCYVKLLDVQEQNPASVCWSNNQPMKCSAAVGVLCCCLSLGSLVNCY